MADELEIIVDADGAQFVYSDELAGVFDDDGVLRTRRASHVEPAGGGRLWQADLGPAGGPVLGPFERRADALAAEAEWLRRAMAERRVEVQP